MYFNNLAFSIRPLVLFGGECEKHLAATWHHITSSTIWGSKNIWDWNPESPGLLTPLVNPKHYAVPFSYTKINTVSYEIYWHYEFHTQLTEFATSLLRMVFKALSVEHWTSLTKSWLWFLLGNMFCSRSWFTPKCTFRSYTLSSFFFWKDGVVLVLHDQSLSLTSFIWKSLMTWNNLHVVCGL